MIKSVDHSYEHFSPLTTSRYTSPREHPFSSSNLVWCLFNNTDRWPSARPCARFWGCKVKSRQSCFPGTGSLVKKYKPTTSKHHKNRHEQGSSECWGTQPIQIGKAGRLPGSLMESHGSWVLKYEWESMRRGKRRTDCSLINSRQWRLVTVSQF